MPSMSQLHGNVLTTEGWIAGVISFHELITGISGEALDFDPTEITRGGDYILPGIIDLHVHGGGGQDVMDAGEAVHVR